MALVLANSVKIEINFAGIVTEIVKHSSDIFNPNLLISVTQSLLLDSPTILAK